LEGERAKGGPGIQAERKERGLEKRRGRAFTRETNPSETRGRKKNVKRKPPKCCVRGAKSEEPRRQTKSHRSTKGGSTIRPPSKKKVKRRSENTKNDLLHLRDEKVPNAKAGVAGGCRRGNIFFGARGQTQKEEESGLQEKKKGRKTRASVSG